MEVFRSALEHDDILPSAIASIQTFGDLVHYHAHIHVIDSGYGVRANQANVKTRHYYPRDYDITATTNSAGMRGSREYSLHQPDGVNRIMTLGDSMVFGFGAEDDEVLSAVLEDSLNAGASGEKRFEVLNPSVSGFGQAELLVTYRE